MGYEHKGSRGHAGKKEREKARPKRGREKGEQAASRNSVEETDATRKFRHKSNDPRANFAGVALPLTCKLREQTREREREGKRK